MIGRQRRALSVIKARKSELANRDSGVASSLVRRITTYGSIVTLILAIASGLYSWYVILIINSEKQSENQRSELGELVGRLAQIEEKMIEREPYEDLPRELSFLGAIESEKSVLLLRAARLIEVIGPEDSGFALVFIARQFMNSDRDNAVKFAQMTIDTQTTLWQISDAYQIIGTINLSEQDFDASVESASEFRSSVEIFFPITSPLAANQASRAYLLWNNRLLYIGQCDRAAEVVNEARQRLSVIEATPIFSIDAFENIIANSYRSQSLCPFPDNGR